MKAANKNTQVIDASTEVTRREKTFLLHGTRKVPIRPEIASKYSLFFRYLESQPLTESEEPVNLLIRNNGQSVVLGPCRILPEPGADGQAGRLVFIDEIYDIPCLLNKNKVIKLQGLFHDLPQALARKEKITQPFKDYVANLVYDLQIYRQIFDQLDSQTSEEPEEVRRAVQEAIIRTEGPLFRQFLQRSIDDLIDLTDGFTPRDHQLHGFYFRNHLREFILSCPFAARAVLKPRGYAGDSEQMRMIYLNEYQGKSTFSKLLHKHAVEHAASQSVRNRIALITQMISDYRYNSRKGDSKIDVLSVGSGAAFELNNLFKSSVDCSRFNVVLFDQDPIAIEEARSLAGAIEEKIGATPEICYIQGSVRTMLFSRKLMEPWGKFDFIYALGLFDYLSTRVARAVLSRLYRLLKPGGELVIGNFNVSNPSRYYMAYWGDWALIHRTEDEFRSLFPETQEASVRHFYDETGCQMFMAINKKSNSA